MNCLLHVKPHYLNWNSVKTLTFLDLLTVNPLGHCKLLVIGCWKTHFLSRWFLAKIKADSILVLVVVKDQYKKVMQITKC